MHTRGSQLVPELLLKLSDTLLLKKKSDQDVHCHEMMVSLVETVHTILVLR